MTTLLNALLIAAVLFIIVELVMQYTMTYLLWSRKHYFYNRRMWIPGWFTLNFYRDTMYRHYTLRECWTNTMNFFNLLRAMPIPGKTMTDPEFNGGGS